MAKLQLALDTTSLEEAIELCKKVEPYIDIIELGTPFCLDFGTAGAKKMKETFPQKEILADIKIFDGGKYESDLFLNVGASYVTVMARTNDSTIKSCIDACNEQGALCMVDMMCVEDNAKRVPELEALGAHIIAVHVAFDQYRQFNITPLSSLKELSSLATTAKVAVAGGIKAENIEEYMQYDPDIVIIGGAITGAEDPVAAAKLFAEAVHK